MSRTRCGACLALAALVGCTAQPDGAASARRLPAETSSAANPRGDALQSEGEALFNSERYDSSRIVLRLALGDARTRRDAAAEARAVTWLALVSWRLSDFAEARQLAEQAIQLDSTNGLPAELSRAHYVRGLVALGVGDNREAVDWFHRALVVAQSANDAEGTARAHGGLGLAYSYLGELPQARESQRTARIAARALGHLRLEANGLANEAMIDIAEGDVGSAIARIDTARQLYQRDGYATGEQNALGQLATAYELMGQQDQAFTVLDSSLALARRLGLPDEEADLLRLIAGLHLQVGDYRRALRHYGDAEIRMRGQGLGASLGSVLRGTASANLRLGNLPKAQEQIQEALRLHTASSEPLDRLDDLLLAVELDYRTTGMAAAEPRLREARSLAGEVNTRGARIAVAVAEAHLADLDRDSRRVLRVLGQAAPDLASGDFGAEWLVSSLEARALARQGALDSAIAAGHRAVGAVERLRGGLASEALRSTYVADRAEVYGDLVLALLRRGRMEEAFSVADGARSRDLLQHLATVQSGQPPQLAEGDQILRRIDQLVQRLRETEGRRPRERGESSDTADAALIEELSAQRSAYEALVVRAAQSNPRTTGVLGASTASLDEVRAALGSGEVLLEYLLTTDRVLIFAVNRSGLTVIESETEGATLANRIRLVRDRWSAPSLTWKDAVPVATALYRTLLEPVERAGLLKGVRRLVIVPHGILGQVPFGALADDSTGRFVAMDFGILHLPSASAFRAMRNRSKRLDVGALGGEGFAPFPSDLPASGREVDAFQSSAPGRSARSGGEATESALREALRHDGIVHVATHGVVNFRSPMFSRLELSRVSGTHSEDDGRLEVHELLGLTIRSPLVFLSGCETGAQQEWLDDPVRGTGDLSLAQAVLSAGAENVIMTLWRIDDAGAAEFAARFYRSLATAPVAEAFAMAQRGMAVDARYGSPYFWAGYTLNGDGGVAPLAQAGPGPSVVFQRPPAARELP